MHYGSLIYKNNINLGDQIQSLASEQFLPRIDRFFDRDTLTREKVDHKHLLIMQGWFSMSPELCFPPPSGIIPVFFGFHISDYNGGYHHFLSHVSLEYLRKHEPVGCRDHSTLELLQKNGVRSFLSLCLTLTFPERKIVPAEGKVIIADAKNVKVPDSVSKDAIYVSHILRSTDLSEETKRRMASDLLSLYRDNARLIITSRLHCALPCIAMGIPVIFFRKKDDKRFSILDDLQIPVYDLDIPVGQVNWNPDQPDVQHLKYKMVKTLEAQIKSRLNPD